jgi:hypothetical protein
VSLTPLVLAGGTEGRLLFARPQRAGPKSVALFARPQRAGPKSVALFARPQRAGLKSVVLFARPRRAGPKSVALCPRPRRAGLKERRSLPSPSAGGAERASLTPPTRPTAVALGPKICRLGKALTFLRARNGKDLPLRQGFGVEPAKRERGHRRTSFGCPSEVRTYQGARGRSPTVGGPRKPRTRAGIRRDDGLERDEEGCFGPRRRPPPQACERVPTRIRLSSCESDGRRTADRTPLAARRAHVTRVRRHDECAPSRRQ